MRRRCGKRREQAKKAGTGGQSALTNFRQGRSIVSMPSARLLFGIRDMIKVLILSKKSVHLLTLTLLREPHFKNNFRLSCDLFPPKKRKKQPDLVEFLLFNAKT